MDYNAIAKQESLSGLEVEMRKLEGVVKEIVDELNYLKRREARMRDTNGESRATLRHPSLLAIRTDSDSERMEPARSLQEISKLSDERESTLKVLEIEFSVGKSLTGPGVFFTRARRRTDCSA